MKIELCLDYAAEHMEGIFNADIVGAAQAGQAGTMDAVVPLLGDLVELLKADGLGVSPLLAEAILAHTLRCINLLICLQANAHDS